VTRSFAVDVSNSASWLGRWSSRGGGDGQGDRHDVPGREEAPAEGGRTRTASPANQVSLDSDRCGPFTADCTAFTRCSLSEWIPAANTLRLRSSGTRSIPLLGCPRKTSWATGFFACKLMGGCTLQLHRVLQHISIPVGAAAESLGSLARAPYLRFQIAACCVRTAAWKVGTASQSPYQPSPATSLAVFGPKRQPACRGLQSSPLTNTCCF